MSNAEYRVERVTWGETAFKVAKDAEFRIFGVANAFVTPEDLAAREMLVYRPYEKKSEFYLAYSHGMPSSSPAGVIRLLRLDPDRGHDSFSTLKDARSYSLNGEASACYLDPEWDSFFRSTDPSTIAELATQAVDGNHRRRGTIEYLWDSLIDVSEQEGISLWTAALVVPMFRWYKRNFPNAIHAIGRVMPQYVGADSVPTVVRIDHQEIKEYQRRFRDVHWNGMAASACWSVVPQELEQTA
jgi:hypothetical protein